MDNATIKKRFEKLEPYLDERLRRLVAGAEALAIGRGGISVVSRATGLCREAIRVGCEELESAETLPLDRIRKAGAGRKRTVDQDPTLKADLERLIDPVTRGDPESPLRWTCKSTRQLTKTLIGMGHQTSHRMVGELLRELGLPITHKSLHTTSIILQQQETLTQKLQGCIPSPHYLMSRGRIFFTAEMTANPCDQLQSFTQ